MCLREALRKPKPFFSTFLGVASALGMILLMIGIFTLWSVSVAPGH
jgi:hypothetical protein